MGVRRHIVYCRPEGHRRARNICRRLQRSRAIELNGSARRRYVCTNADTGRPSESVVSCHRRRNPSIEIYICGRVEPQGPATTSRQRAEFGHRDRTRARSYGDVCGYQLCIYVSPLDVGWVQRPIARERSCGVRYDYWRGDKRVLNNYVVWIQEQRPGRTFRGQGVYATRIRETVFAGNLDESSVAGLGAAARANRAVELRAVV